MSKQVTFNEEKTYYGKTVLQEDDLPSGLYRLSPCPDYVSPFTDMPPAIVPTQSLKPFFDDSREIALRRLAKQDAQLECQIAELRLEIADKLYEIERQQYDHQKNSNNLFAHSLTGLTISKLYSEIETVKLKIKMKEVLRQVQVKDEWEKIQRWTE